MPKCPLGEGGALESWLPVSPRLWKWGVEIWNRSPHRAIVWAIQGGMERVGGDWEEGLHTPGAIPFGKVGLHILNPSPVGRNIILGAWEDASSLAPPLRQRQDIQRVKKKKKKTRPRKCAQREEVAGTRKGRNKGPILLLNHAGHFAVLRVNPESCEWTARKKPGPRAGG